MENKKLKRLDIMLDVETLGNSASPIITQLSAVAFSLEDGVLEDAEFNQFIHPMSARKYGLSTKSDNPKIENSFDWWLRQDKDVFNKVILRSFHEGRDLKEVLENFSKWIESLKEKYQCKEIKVYGNGPAGDNVWVRSSYWACGLDAPFSYSNDVCVRTYVDIGREAFSFDPKKEVPFDGEKHNAIDDCKHQIKYVCLIYKKIKREIV